MNVSQSDLCRRVSGVIVVLPLGPPIRSLVETVRHVGIESSCVHPTYSSECGDDVWWLLCWFVVVTIGRVWLLPTGLLSHLGPLASKRRPGVQQKRASSCSQDLGISVQVMSMNACLQVRRLRLVLADVHGESTVEVSHVTPRSDEQERTTTHSYKI